MQKNIPAISIIIPTYNVEKYIGECLNSILNQTFTDFEVIVVDDCSTDNSPEIVENYIPKFEGKLQLIRLEKNSGGHVGIPRNVGIKHACGEYFFFFDSDDAIIPEAMEIMYTHAKKFDVDVVHCDKCFTAPDDETFTTDKNLLKVLLRHADKDIKQPTFMHGDLRKRVDSLIKMRWEPWNHLIRRDFLMKNNILFPIISIADDVGFFLKFCFWRRKFC